MRKIDKIIIHCSATKAGQHFTVEDIDRWHKACGFAKIGYHYVIYLDGSVHKGRPEEQTGAHTLGQNSSSVGICYIGGLDAAGKPSDTRTEAQKASLIRLINDLRIKYPEATVHGHNEFAAKACPCFDAKREFAPSTFPDIEETPALLGRDGAGCLLLCLFLALSGCKSNTVYVPVESVRTEYRDRLQRDSIHLYDSVFVKLKGDTIWLEKYKYIYCDRLRTDTVAQSDTIAIPYPVVETREVKIYPRWLVVLACIGSLAAGIAGWRMYRKVLSLF
jgi:N-acetylmuramoyl-L-alanine amidase